MVLWPGNGQWIVGVHCPICSRHLCNVAVTGDEMGPFACPAHGDIWITVDYGDQTATAHLAEGGDERKRRSSQRSRRR